MIKSLEKNYRADLHRLALQLASILARKKDITPLNFGIHCLPEEIVQVSKVMNNEEDEGSEFMGKTFQAAQLTQERNFLP